VPTYRVPPPGQPPATPDPAAASDPERLLVGLAAGTGTYSLDQWQRCAGAARQGPPLPLRRNHEQELLIFTGGAAAAEVGRLLEYAAIPASESHPAGLLVLAELHPAFAGIRADVDSGQWGGLSVGVKEISWPSDPPGTPAVLELLEVSLTRLGDQADEVGLVIATGPRARIVWQILTELAEPQ
jgi:hypothetical protein